jgi:hypothetical protein
LRNNLFVSQIAIRPPNDGWRAKAALSNIFRSHPEIHVSKGHHLGDVSTSPVKIAGSEPALKLTPLENKWWLPVEA